MNRTELTEIFKKLGAPNPESWVESQITESIPQLARFLFLKGAWQNIVKEGDTDWIDAEITGSLENPDSPYAGIGLSLKKIIDCGIPKSIINELVRGLQAQLLFNLCYLLEDSSVVEGNEDYAHWTLYQVDEYGEPLEPITGLHESVLETDPTGREMRPKQSDWQRHNHIV